MIKPTIGRVVLVRMFQDQAQLFPALVSHVHNDRLINVGGFDSNGQPFALTSLELLQDDDVAQHEFRHASWMDYQKEAQAKIDASAEELTQDPANDPVQEPTE